MADKIDLTNKSGLEKYFDFVKENPVMALGAPGPYFFYKMVKKAMSSGGGSKVDQMKAVENLIKKCRENRVKRIKVVIDSNAGVDLSVPIEGVNIKASALSGGKIELDMEFDYSNA